MCVGKLYCRRRRRGVVALRDCRGVVVVVVRGRADCHDVVAVTMIGH